MKNISIQENYDFYQFNVKLSLHELSKLISSGKFKQIFIIRGGWV